MKGKQLTSMSATASRDTAAGRRWTNGRGGYTWNVPFQRGRRVTPGHVLSVGVPRVLLEWIGGLGWRKINRG